MDYDNLMEYDQHFHGTSTCGGLLCDAMRERGDAGNFIFIFAGRTSGLATSIISPYLFSTQCKVDDGNQIQIHQDDSLVRMAAVEEGDSVPPRQISRSRTERRYDGGL